MWNITKNRLEVAGVTVSKAKVLLAPNSEKSMVGRDWLVARRYRFNQPIERGDCERYNKNVNCVHPVNEVKNANCVHPMNEVKTEEQLTPGIQQLMGEFPKLFTRKDRVKNNEIKMKMKDSARSFQQKGRLIPNQSQNQVPAEIDKLLTVGHIEQVEKIRDDVFIQPTVITVKKDRSVKIALNARALNVSLAEDKYQMPNLDTLIDSIAEKLDEKKAGEAVDMTYAYGQVPVNESTKRHCNFKL